MAELHLAYDEPRSVGQKNRLGRNAANKLHGNEMHLLETDTERASRWVQSNSYDLRECGIQRFSYIAQSLSIIIQLNSTANKNNLVLPRFKRLTVATKLYNKN